MNDTPSFTNYGEYQSDNYGAHTLRFDDGAFTFWFSYKTLVAFRTIKTGLVVRQNEWGTTTGKHLNWIDGGDKKARVDGDTFFKMLSEARKQDQEEAPDCSQCEHNPHANID